MSHRTIIDNWNRFANCSDILDDKEAIGVDTAKSGDDYSARAILSGSDLDNLAAGKEVILKRIAHTGWLVLQRMQDYGGRKFIAPSCFDTKTEADLYASNFHNVVAIMPIEWEE